MQHPEEKNLYIRISEFGYKNPDGFTQEELEKNLDLNDWEKKIVNKQISDTLNGGQFVHTDREGHGGMLPVRNTMFLNIENDKFILNHDAFFNYIDYREFREALRSSKTAKNMALFAIVISSVLALASILIQLFGSVTLDNVQFKKILNQSEGKHRPKNILHKEYKNFNYIR
ncbi:MAG: hypothetical protein WC819_00885 [Parcubacteria group bacterium]|jgi:hypothetical protein